MMSADTNMNAKSEVHQVETEELDAVSGGFYTAKNLETQATAYLKLPSWEAHMVAAEPQLHIGPPPVTI
jgi:hypothetical protein